MERAKQPVAVNVKCPPMRGGKRDERLLVAAVRGVEQCALIATVFRHGRDPSQTGSGPPSSVQAEGENAACGTPPSAMNRVPSSPGRIWRR